MLKRIDQGDGVEVSGPSWIPHGTHRQLPPNALANRVLCREHNSRLSRYDVVGERVFTAIGDRIDAAHRAAVPQPTERIDAELLARWILKMFCVILERS